MGVRFGGILLPVGVRDQFAVGKGRRIPLTDSAFWSVFVGAASANLLSATFFSPCLGSLVRAKSGAEAQQPNTPSRGI